MSRFLNTEGKSSLAIGICDRCARKFPIGDLMADPNSPGLRVCSEDRDILDPYRMGAKRIDNIDVSHPRPDVPLDLA